MKYLIVMTVLLVIFSIYNFTIYTSKSNYGNVHLSEKAIKGETLWLKNNCNSCHQIYGLGGYLGPDLTNIYSSKGKGGTYIKSIVNSGIKTMPRFNFNETEKDELVQFLKEIDQTGHYPNVGASIEPSGWVTIKYKNNNHDKQ
ncbi:MAG: c-type cytochrome [Flavobacterium sp.]